MKLLKLTFIFLPLLALSCSKSTSKPTPSQNASDLNPPAHIKIHKPSLDAECFVPSKEEATCSEKDSSPKAESQSTQDQNPEALTHIHRPSERVKSEEEEKSPVVTTVSIQGVSKIATSSVPSEKAPVVSSEVPASAAAPAQVKKEDGDKLEEGQTPLAPFRTIRPKARPSNLMEQAHAHNEDEETSSEKTESDPKVNRWKEENLPLVFKIPQDTSDEIFQASQRAADNWNKALGLEILKVEKGNFENQNIEDPRIILKLEENKIFFNTESWNTQKMTPHLKDIKDPKKNAAAITKNSILKDFYDRSLIVFNFHNHNNFSFEPNSDCDQINFELILTHELGHSLGIRHIETEKDPESVMHPVLKCRDSNLPSAKDIELLKKIYSL